MENAVMSTNKDQKDMAAGVEERMASDVLAMLNNLLKRAHPNASDGSAGVAMRSADSFARDIAAKLTRARQQTQVDLDEVDWEVIVDDAVQDWFKEAEDAAPLIKIFTEAIDAGVFDDRFDFVMDVADCTCATLALEGLAPREPKWGADDARNMWAVRRVKDPARLTQMAEDIISGKAVAYGLLSESLISNPNLPFAMAHRLSLAWKGSLDFGWPLFARPDATPEVLAKWSDDWDMEATQAVAKHPNTSIETLKRMAMGMHPWAFQSALSSPRMPQEFINGRASSGHPDVRIIVARKTKDPAILEKLAADVLPDIRVEAVQNEHTPAHVISAIAKTDKDMSVVTAAARKLTDATELLALAERLTDKFDEGLRQAILQNPNSCDIAKTVAVLVSGHRGTS
jgi:hypothetical protein